MDPSEYSHLKAPNIDRHPQYQHESSEHVAEAHNIVPTDSSLRSNFLDAYLQMSLLHQRPPLRDPRKRIV